eukprot:1151777-Pelagomonas_calceolata.AAC.2
MPFKLLTCVCLCAHAGWPEQPVQHVYGQHQRDGGLPIAQAAPSHCSTRPRRAAAATAATGCPGMPKGGEEQVKELASTACSSMNSSRMGLWVAKA